MVYQKPRVNLPSSFRQTSPEWAGTPQHQPKVLLPGGGHLNAADFSSADASTVSVTANAAGGATSLTVAALPVAIPSGTILDFTGTGGFAKVTTSADAGATTLAVEALPQAISSGATASYSPYSHKLIQSGTLVGRTFAERDAGTGYGVADTVNDNEVFLLYFDVPDATRDNECELYMHGNVVYENFIPNWATLPTATKTFIRSKYTCITGVV